MTAVRVIIGVVTIGAGNVVLRAGIAVQIFMVIIDVFRETVDDRGCYYAFCIDVILIFDTISNATQPHLRLLIRRENDLSLSF